MPTDSLMPVYAALTAGVCSLAGVWGVATWNKWSERKYDARQLAKAFKGELHAIVNILELRNYQAGLRLFAAACRRDEKVHVYSVSARHEYRVVYLANASKIGCLPGNLPEEIATIYTYATALLEDFASSDEIRRGDKSIEVLGTWQQAAARYEGIADHIDGVIDKSKAVMAHIDRIYPA